MLDKKKILIVDDLPENIELYSIFIKSAFDDVAILSLVDSREAVDTVRKERPDLIILDAKMPAVSGFDVCRQLKSDPETASILILMVSAVLIHSRDRTTGLNVGADGYLCKPFEKDEMLAQIKAFFRISDFEEQLQNARREAERSNESQSRFLAQMSHEIRTPMNAVIGMTQLLLAGDLNEEQRDMAETIKQSGDSLMRIINDILDFSKIESGKMEVHKDDFRLSNCVDAVISLLAYTAQSKGIELSYSISEGVPEIISSDYDRIRQVLVNLAGNAVKFTNAGYVRLHVDLDCGAPKRKKRAVRFTVEDTGIGIAHEHQKLLFQPFSQVDSTDTRKFQGTGLGLSISHRIVEMLEGEIHLESAPGTGSRFWFTIPVADLSDMADSGAAEAEAFSPVLAEEIPVPANPQILAEAYPFSILLAEDNIVNQKVAEKMAASLGYKVDCVDNGSKVLEMLDNRDYDVIFMDMQMPVMDGWDATRQIRASIPLDRQPYIIAMTAGVMSGEREKCFEAGIDAFVPKPIRIDELEKALISASSKIKYGQID